MSSPIFSFSFISRTPMFFDELDLGDDLLDALYEMHFDECTPIQAMAIPAALEEMTSWLLPRQAQARRPRICSRS